MRSLREVARVLTRGEVALERNARTFSSKITDVMAAGGTPAVATGRKATIYSPSRNPMQSGSAQTLAGGAPAWRIALDTEGKWTNPLMGWTSTGDTLETMSRQMYFRTKEAAIAFVEKAGMEYEVVEPAEVPKGRPKRFPGYGSNYDVNRLAGGKPIGGLRSEQQGGKK